MKVDLVVANTIFFCVTALFCTRKWRCWRNKDFWDFSRRMPFPLSITCMDARKSYRWTMGAYFRYAFGTNFLGSWKHWLLPYLNWLLFLQFPLTRSRTFFVKYCMTQQISKWHPHHRPMRVIVANFYVGPMPHHIRNFEYFTWCVWDQWHSTRPNFKYFTSVRGTNDTPHEQKLHFFCDFSPNLSKVAHISPKIAQISSFPIKILNSL